MKNVKILAVVLALFLGCPTVQSVDFYHDTNIRNGVLLGIGVGISALCLKYLYDYCTASYTSDQLLNDYCTASYTPDQLLELIITNPTKVSSYLEKNNDALAKKFEQKTSHASRFELLQQCEKICPLCLLSECNVTPAGFCKFSRCKNPRFRECFESKAVAAINEKLKGDKPVNYVGFGSGGMLQDLIIIAKALAQNPTAQININLLDPHYWCYAAARDDLKNGRVIGEEADYVLELEAFDKVFKNMQKEAKGYDQEYYSEDHKVGFEKEVIVTGMRAKQFISFLKQVFPKAKPTLSIYASGDDFVKHMETKNLPYPDVITAADIQDDMESTSSMPAYAFFSLYIKKMHPLSINLWLFTDGQSIGISSFSINEVQGACQLGTDWFTRKPDYAAKVTDQGWITSEWL